MDFPLHVNQQQVADLKYEVIPDDFKVYLTRLLIAENEKIDTDPLWWQNDLINRARLLVGLPIYVLECDDMGTYEPFEYVWHNSEIRACIRRLGTVELVEFLVELENADKFPLSSRELNQHLEKAGSSVRLRPADGATGVEVEVLPLTDLDALVDVVAHPNIRVLVARLDAALEQTDNALVLHTSASIFEALAKEVVGRTSVQDQTLAGFFEAYRKESRLPEPVLDYILGVYKRRNTEPLAGHGSLMEPAITTEDAHLLAALTKALVVAERQPLPHGHTVRSGTATANS